MLVVMSPLVCNVSLNPSDVGVLPMAFPWISDLIFLWAENTPRATSVTWVLVSVPGRAARSDELGDRPVRAFNSFVCPAGGRAL